MLWHCRDCSCSYAVGLPACPQCGSTDHDETGAEPTPRRERAKAKPQPDAS